MIEVAKKHFCLKAKDYIDSSDDIDDDYIARGLKKSFLKNSAGVSVQNKLLQLS
jgi:hypothetical protein